MARILIALALLTISLSFHQNQTENGKHSLRICQLGFDEHQGHQQQKASQRNTKAAKQTFKTNSQLLPYIMFRYKYNFNREYQTFKSLVKPQVQGYSKLYKYSLIVFAAVCFYFVFRFIFVYAKLQFKALSFRDSRKFNILASVVCLICLTTAFFLAAKGFQEGTKTEKTLSSIICKIYTGPKNIVKGYQGPSNRGYYAYSNQIQKYQRKFRHNFVSLQRVISNQYVIKQMVLFGKEMMELKGVQTAQLIAFREQMNRTVGVLEKVDSIIPKIKKQLKLFNKTIEYARQLIILLNIVFDAIEDYSNLHLPFSTIAKLFGSLIKVFYTVLIIITAALAITIASILLKRQNRLRLNHSFMEWVLLMPIIICLLTAYANSFAIPAVVWLNQVVDYSSQGQLYVRNVFTLPLRVRSDLVNLLTHFIPVNASDFTTLYSGNLMKNISQYGSIVQPYHSTNTSYFDQLFQHGIQLFKQSERINVRRIRFLQKQMLMKDIIVNFQGAKEAIKQILSTTEPNGQLTAINPSACGEHVREFYRAIRGPLFNRIYNARWICGSIGTLLLIALICLILMKDIDKKQSPKYKKVLDSQEKSVVESQLFTNDS